MRTCDEIEADLSAYLDGELPAQERAGIESHLSGCAACKAAFDEIQSAHRALAALKEMKSPASLRAKVIDEIAAGSPRLDEISSRRIASGQKRGRFSWTLLASGIAATVFI